jgi:cyclophilin family peptidyl-prolyl cis-trans isomerase
MGIRRTGFAAVILLTIGLSLVGCRKKPADSGSATGHEAGTETTTTEPKDAVGAGSTEQTMTGKGTGSKTPSITPDVKNTQVVLETSKGNITIELYQNIAPVTVTNFLQYVNDGFYNGTIFHRVIPGFMIQGGGMTADMTEKETRSAILNEASNGLKNDRGTIAMARTSLPHTATSQFFINHRDNASLNYGSPTSPDGYAVFGKVISGMEIVDSIAIVPTTTKGPHQNVPVEPVVIAKARVVAGN